MLSYTIVNTISLILFFVFYGSEINQYLIIIPLFYSLFYLAKDLRKLSLFNINSDYNLGYQILTLITQLLLIIGFVYWEIRLNHSIIDLAAINDSLLNQTANTFTFDITQFWQLQLFVFVKDLKQVLITNATILLITYVIDENFLANKLKNN